MPINVSSVAANNNALQSNKNNNDNKNNNVAFKGKLGDLKDSITLTRGGTMSRGLFIANAFVFLLGSRLVTSRDSDEKREILIRDIPSIVFAVVGVPIFQKGIAKLMQKKTGIAVMSKPTEPKAKSEVYSYGQIDGLYKFNENLKSGITGFCQRLADKGCDLKKVFAQFGDDLKSVTEHKDIVAAGEDNNKIIDAIKNNETIKKSLSDAFKGSENKALKQASFLKTMSAVGGYATTLTLLGICIPKLNIAITERLNKNKKTNETETKAPEAK